MKQINIEIPEGYEIDLDKSDLTKGVVKFKKKEINLPKTWEEIKYLDGSYVDDESRVIPVVNRENKKYNKNIFKTHKQAEANIALSQLSQLRDIYRQGWKPDWNDGTAKYCIIFDQKYLKVCSFISYNMFLSFQTKDIAQKFLVIFRHLIEETRPLMS